MAKMVKFDILDANGKKVGTQTHADEYAPVLMTGQTAQVADETKVKDPEPSTMTTKAAPAAKK